MLLFTDFRAVSVPVICVLFIYCYSKMSLDILLYNLSRFRLFGPSWICTSDTQGFDPYVMVGCLLAPTCTSRLRDRNFCLPIDPFDYMIN